MTNFEKHIERAGERERLTETEKARMFSVIQQYMAHKPLRMPASGVTSVWSISWVSIIHRPLAAALVLVLVCGSGISYAAETALPGDALYAVKTMVTEPVRVALATDAEAKVEVQIELAERRIAEAAELAADGRLDAETQEELAIAFESHADAAALRMEEIEKEDSSAATEFSSSFETRLAAHESILASVQSEKDPDSRLSRAIRTRGLAVADIRTRAEKKLAVSADMDIAADAMAMTMPLKFATPETAPATETEASSTDPEIDTKAAKRMYGAAEKKLVAIKKNRSKIAKLEGSERAEIEAEIEHAEILVEEGKDHLDGKEAALAYHSFQESLIISERLDVFLMASPALAKVRSRNARNSQNAANVRTTATMEAMNARDDARAFGAPTSSGEQFSTQLDASSSNKVIPPSIQIFVPIIDELIVPEHEGEDASSTIQLESETPINL